jgi:iron complex transport system ATP-binding protein
MSLVIENLAFRYSRQPVLAGVTAGPLQRGQLTSLVGPNGSGKSTLFRCLGGALQPRIGRALLDGRDLADLKGRERARRVFYLAQDLGARAALSVFEVVLLARKSLAAGFSLRADAADLRAVEAALADLGLSDLGGRPIGDLSGGQRQLVGVAQALVREPDVLLLDEPTSALDVRRQLEVMETIGRVTRERRMVAVAAIHDLSLAARFSDHLLVLQDGRIAEEGVPEAVLDRRAIADTYRVGIHLERSARGSLLVESYLPTLRAAE